MVFPLIPLIGAAVGGVIGAVVGASIEKSKELDSELRFRRDPDGLLLMLSSGKVLKDDLFVIHARDKNNGFRKANTSVFCSDAGDFALVGQSTGGVTELYCPFGCIYPESSGLRISVRGIRSKGSGYELLGEDFYNLDFPYKPFTMAGLWRPMVGLCMTVARADKAITAEEVRYVREFMIDFCGVPKSESDTLKNIIKSEPSYQLADLVYMMRYRFPNLAGKAVVEALCGLAAADAHPNKAEIDIIETIAQQYGVAEHDWWQIAERNGFNTNRVIAEFLEILGLSGSPSAEEINRAYKLKMKYSHPDKHYNASDEVKRTMHQKSTELAKARDELIRYFYQ